MTLGDWRKKIPGKYGFIDTKGKVRVKLIYDEAKDFKNGYAEVRINNKWGVINMDGKIVISIKYDELHRGDTFKDLFTIYKKGEFISDLGIYNSEFIGYVVALLDKRQFNMVKDHCERSNFPN